MLLGMDAELAILHVDMDAFFASVEQLDFPELRGRPVIVGGPAEGRGVVSAASYEAREFGVHSAMPTAQAQRLCPHGVCRPGRMERYAEVSGVIHEIFERYTPLVEPLSLDEAFLDVTGSRRLFGPAAEIGRRIKADIKRETGLTGSVGVATNKFLAKLGSDLEKPDGFVVLEPERVLEVLDPLPISRLWGVGKVTHKQLTGMGLYTFRDVRERSAKWLEERLGDLGTHIGRLARGLDDRPVVPDHEAKSLGAERTFARDVSDVQAQREILLHLADHVARRLRRHDLQTRCVTVKLRYGDFRTVTRSATLRSPTGTTEQIRAAAGDLHDRWARKQAGALRLLGVACSQLSAAGSGQLMLFEDPGEAKQRRLDEALDTIQDKFGDGALSRGGFRRPGRLRRREDPHER